MRILLISHSAGLLGAERSLLEIARDARHDGHEVMVTAPHEGPLTEALVSAGCAVVLLPTYSWMGPHHWFPLVGLLRRAQSARSVPAFRRTIREAAPDIVVTNTSVVPAAARAAAEVGVPHVWIVRESITRNGQLKALRKKRAIVEEIFDHSAAVCSISAFVDLQIDEASPGRAAALHRVQPNPTRVTAPDHAEDGIRDIFTVLLPGYLSAEKGQHRAVLAMKVARSLTSTPMRLVLVGRGSRAYTVFLHLAVAVLGLRDSVQIHGWTNDMDAFYSQADVTLCTSRNEAYGRVMAESLGHGVPVVAGLGGIAREILGETGGLVVEKPGAKALGAVLARWSTEPRTVRRARRVGARRRANELCSMPSQYEQLRSVLTAIVGDEAVPA